MDHFDHSYLLPVDGMGEDAEEVFENSNEGCNETELCRLVSGRRLLYDKKNKDYLNAALKARVWTSIGMSLPVPVSGSEAEKAFYKLRQRFGKERRKIRDSTPRSGAGANVPTYVPEWPLYKELLFLADFIQSRERTSTNHVSKDTAAPGKSQFVAGSSRGGRGRSLLIPGPSRCSTPVLSVGRGVNTFAFTVPSSQGRGLSQGVPEVMTSTSAFNLEENAPDTAITSGDDMNVAAIEDLDFSTIEVPSADESQSSNSTLTSASQGVVPQPDYSYKQRRRDVDRINKKIEKSSDNVSKLVESLGAALQKAVGGTESAPPPSSPTPTAFANFPPPVQSMLTTLGFAVAKVHEDEQVQCMIDLLGLVNSKYIHK